MIRLNLLEIRTRDPEGKFECQKLDTVTYVDPSKIDTVTPITPEGRKSEHLHDRVNTVIRYIDVVRGYRLLFVSDLAPLVAEARYKFLNGDNPYDPLGLS